MCVLIVRTAIGCVRLRASWKTVACVHADVHLQFRYDSRHTHAVRRPRRKGRFLTKEELQQEREQAAAALGTGADGDNADGSTAEHDLGDGDGDDDDGGGGDSDDGGSGSERAPHKRRRNDTGSGYGGGGSGRGGARRLESSEVYAARLVAIQPSGDAAAPSASAYGASAAPSSTALARVVSNGVATAATVLAPTPGRNAVATPAGAVDASGDSAARLGSGDPAG